MRSKPKTLEPHPVQNERIIRQRHGHGRSHGSGNGASVGAHCRGRPAGWLTQTYKGKTMILRAMLSPDRSTDRRRRHTSAAVLATALLMLAPLPVQAEMTPAQAPAPASPAPAPAADAPVAPPTAGVAPMATGSAEAGERVFMKCRACHQIGEGAKHTAGPQLNGLIARKAGTVEGYRFSDPMKTSGLTWDAATLRDYLRNPRAKVVGTRMIFLGLPKDKDVEDLLAYLGQFDATGQKKP